MLNSAVLVVFILFVVPLLHAEGDAFVFMESMPTFSSLHRQQTQSPYTRAKDIPNSAKEMDVTISIKQQNLDVLEETLLAVSDPASLRYGQHMTFEQVGRLVENRPATDAVLAWMKASGAVLIFNSTFGEYITARAKVEVIERMFNTKISAYATSSSSSSSSNNNNNNDINNFFDRVAGVIDGEPVIVGQPEAIPASQSETMPSSSSSGGSGSTDSRSGASLPNEFASTILRGDSYSIPASLVPHITAVLDLVHLPPRIQHHGRLDVESRRRATTTSSSATIPTDDVAATKTAAATATSSRATPGTLRDKYHIVDVGNSLASQSVFASLGQAYSDRDLAIFQKSFGLPAMPMTNVIGLEQVVARDQQDAYCKETPGNCVEGQLDAEYITSTAKQVPTTFWYANNPDVFVGWIKNVSSLAAPPLVHSISYGGYEMFVNPSVVKAFDVEAMKLGVRGVTIVVASGDDGVAGFAISEYGNVGMCGYYAIWPASAKYVTAVGATMGSLGTDASSPEVACSARTGSGITSGGGFSNVTTGGSWQTAAVAQYFSLFKADNTGVRTGLTSKFNSALRAYPDVSMAGDRFEIVLGGDYIWTVSGTSASAPLFAGLVSLVNANRLAANKSPLGFLNPAIWANKGAFCNDITSGDNFCTRDAALCCQHAGFSTAQGWDPVTGFGSVDYQKFKSYFMSLSTITGSTSPTLKPTLKPGTTAKPTAKTPMPSTVKKAPSPVPTRQPTKLPTPRPTQFPTSHPTSRPTSRPTARPTARPTSRPSDRPSTRPTSGPTNWRTAKTQSVAVTLQIIGAIFGFLASFSCICAVWCRVTYLKRIKDDEAKAALEVGEEEEDEDDDEEEEQEGVEGEHVLEIGGDEGKEEEEDNGEVRNPLQTHDSSKGEQYVLVEGEQKRQSQQSLYPEAVQVHNPLTASQKEQADEFDILL